MKENVGLEKASENAAGSDRTSQYNQYKGEEERERRARQKGGKVHWMVLAEGERSSQ